MPMIIIDISGFPAEYPVYKVEGTKSNIISYTTPEMVEELIPRLCFNHGIENVRIVGLASYAEKLAAAIRTNYNFNYNQNLNVEVF